MPNQQDEIEGMKQAKLNDPSRAELAQIYLNREGITLTDIVHRILMYISELPHVERTGLYEQDCREMREELREAYIKIDRALRHVRE